jgi:hypothetical protein
MTTATVQTTEPAAPSPAPTLRSLALTDARRYARHPLFLGGVALLVIYAVLYPFSASDRSERGAGFTIVTAFALGVLGFVVAHRLTTSLRRSRDLVDTAPVSPQLRTGALCLACLVPAATGALFLLYGVLAARWWPPVNLPPGAHVAWFSDEPDLAILAMLVAAGPVAALGGPLLGVAVGRWAPFRGSALLGMVVLTVGCTAAIEAPPPWRVLPPWASLVDERAENGFVVFAQMTPGVVPQWYLGYVLCLCGLAVVAALLHDATDRRRLLGIGSALVVGAAVCLVLTTA